MNEKVLELIADQFNVDIEDLEEETSFVDDLGADSIQLMELVMNLEDEFDIELDEDEIVSIETIGDVIEYIKEI